MADDKTRTDATESGSDERDADRQVSVADLPATRSSSTSDTGDAADAGKSGFPRPKPVLGAWRHVKRPAVLVSSLLVLLLAASTAYLGFRVVG